MYAIVDIETTGLSPKREKITEIAIFIHDGEKITNSFHTLLNPERSIPANITQLTGITNTMVENAPRFFEVARDIIELTKDKIVIGHNISFDYNFIQAEYRALGYEFSRKTLCTVKLSRKMFPGFKSYSLGNICFELGINNNSRHRAEGDAYATVKLFELLLKKDGNNGASFSEVSALPFKNLHPLLKKEVIENLPNKEGVYYFYNEKGDLIYIGKSKNIFKRVIQHLGTAKTEKAAEMRQQIVDIHYELTGNELIALLLESAEIKFHKPLFNRSQRRSLFNQGIYFHYDENGYINFKVAKTKDHDIPLSTFNSKKNALGHLEALVMKHRLCHKLSGLYDSNGACFHYTIHQCNGACVGQESVEIYNERALKAIESFEFHHQNFIIIDKAKSETEKSVIVIENGKYLGFGTIDLETFEGDLDFLKESIKPQQDNRDVQTIIKTYLKNKKVEQIITF